MLRAIMWFILGFVAALYAVKPKVSKGSGKVAEMDQQGADHIKEELGQPKKGRRNEILFRKFSL